VGRNRKRGRSGRSDAFLTNREADFLRWTGVATTVLDLSSGSLWWVRESLWTECLGPTYGRTTTRRAHPGLSAMRDRISDLFSQVPMFHGTSGARGPVIVCNLTPADASEKVTSFGHLIAPSVRVSEWLPVGHARRVERNAHKPRLDPGEQAQFDAFLERNGLL
jgi:hypothetical protein